MTITDEPKNNVEPTEPTHVDLAFQLDQILELVKVLIRQKRSDKIELLERELMKRGALTVRNVTGLLNVTRTHALTLMRALSEMSLNVRFVVGDKQTQMPSKVMLVGGIETAKMKKVMALHNRLMSVLNKDYVTMTEIMKELGVEYAEARSVCIAFCDRYPDFFIDDSACEYERLPLSEGVRLKLRSTSEGNCQQ